MEKSVTDGKLAFSRSDAMSKNVNWMSLIIPNDANVIKANLEGFKKEKIIPPELSNVDDSNYFDSRYQASISWIAQHGHAVISNGPYYLDSYSPDARKITIKAFDDPTYPFKSGYWKKFEQVSMPEIQNIQVPTAMVLGSSLTIPISVTPNATVYYYFTNPEGKIVDNGNQTSANGTMAITLNSEKTKNFELGSNDLQIFLVSDQAYKPDMYHTSFLVTQGENHLATENPVSSHDVLGINYGYVAGIVVLAIAVFLVMVYAILRKRKSRVK
jgi:peptide/nickel transport system substrate-binding protein